MKKFLLLNMMMLVSVVNACDMANCAFLHLYELGDCPFHPPTLNLTCPPQDQWPIRENLDVIDKLIFPERAFPYRHIEIMMKPETMAYVFPLEYKPLREKAITRFEERKAALQDEKNKVLRMTGNSKEPAVKLTGAIKRIDDYIKLLKTMQEYVHVKDAIHVPARAVLCALQWTDPK